MSQRIRFAAMLAALALVVVACGSGTVDSTGADELPPNPAAACHSDAPDCNDTPSDGPGGNDTPLQPLDEPQLEPGDPGTPGQVVTGMPIAGGGLSVADALATDTDGPIAVVGFLIQDADGARLCDLLAESLPPQCGGASIELSDISTIDPDELKTAQGVTWTDFPVTVIGEIAGSVFNVTPMSQ